MKQEKKWLSNIICIKNYILQIIVIYSFFVKEMFVKSGVKQAILDGSGTVIGAMIMAFGI